MKIPSAARHCFWSYDFAKININEDASLVIQQILNYGDWRLVKWLFNAYNEKQISRVLRSPSRGVWWPKVLNFWLKVLNLRIPKDTYALAIREIDPAKVDQKALMRFFKRVEKEEKRKKVRTLGG